MSVEIVFPFGLISVLGNATDANSRHQSEYILFFQEAKSRYNGKHISCPMKKKKLLESYGSNDSRSRSNDWKKKGVGEVRTSLP